MPALIRECNFVGWSPTRASLREREERTLRWRRAAFGPDWIGDDVPEDLPTAVAGPAGDSRRLHDLRHLLTRAELELELGAGDELRRTLQAARGLCEPDRAGPSAVELDLCALIEDEARAVQRTYPDREVRALVPGACSVLVSEVALRRVLANLLANGARATPPGSRVEAELRCTPDGACVLRVRDSGPGMPADRIDQLLATQTSAAGGSGLGSLSVTEAARELRATIVVRSAAGDGTEFEVRLPP